MTRIGIYTRLSHDKGEQTSTHRQLEACRAFAGMRGWEVSHVYEDVDYSAFKKGVVRPEYEALLNAVVAGALDGVVVWKLDRLVRRPAEFERFWTTCEGNNTFLASAMEPIDGSTDLGVALIRILVAFASLEAATIGVRTSAMLRERAENGIPHSPHPVYGLKRGWQEIEPAQAKYVREAADRVLAGESLRSIALDWNQRGVRPPRVEKWTTSQLRRILVAPRLVGDRVYRGEVVARDCFPAILDRQTFDRVRQILTDPRRRTVPVPTPQRPMLSGLVWCGKCGSRLYALTSRNTAVKIFRCPSAPKGCNGTSILQESLTSSVAAQVQARILQIRREGSRAPFNDVTSSTLSQRLEVHAAALAKLAEDFYVYRLISREEYRAGCDALQEELHSDPNLEPMSVPPELAACKGRKSLAAAWSTLDDDKRRTVIRTLVRRVVVESAARCGRPNARGGSTSNPARIKITWRDDEGTPALSQVWMTVGAAAATFGLTKRSLYGALRCGALSGEKVGTTWVVRRTDVDRFRSAAT